MNILIVEDDAENRALLRTALEETGYSVLEAADGVEAMQTLGRGPVDAVITDILMPRMDGYNLCHQIRTDPKLRHLPIIIYTATYTSSSDEKLAHELGADKFLRKPAAVEELTATLRVVLDRAAGDSPKVVTDLEKLGSMQNYSQGLVDKLEQRTLDLEKSSAALRDSEMLYRQVFDSANDALFLFHVDERAVPGPIIDVNEVATQMLGYSREELLGRTVLDFEPPEEKAILPEIAKRINANQRLLFERILVAKDGRRIQTEVSARIFNGKAGRLSIAAVRDITERKRAEEMLRESEQRLQKILDNLFAFVALLSTDGVLLEVNRVPLEAAGLRRSEVIGKSFSETYWWSYSTEVQMKLREALAQAARGESVRYDAKVRISQDRHMIIDFAVNPLLDAAGKVVELVASAMDITERKKLEEQFLRAQRLEVIGTLASGLAHDLNNILAAMLMAAGLLKEKLTESRDRNMVRMIEVSAQRGAGVIRQLLTFSRGLGHQRVSVQMRHLIDDIAQLMRETFPRNIEIIPSVPKSLWTVSGDVTQMHQVLMNLCVNARDAMPVGGQLTLSARNVQVVAGEKPSTSVQPGRYVLVEVKDTGVGIPPEIIDRIFDTFFTTKSPEKGTGLGLAMVQSIVKDHGGAVLVESKPGEGATFRIYLPASAEIIEHEPVETGDALPSGEGELILLVDDEATLRETGRILLEEHRYRVLTASNGEEGFHFYIHNRDSIRLVVTDIMMPVMGGLELIRSLRMLEPTVKIIVICGSDEENKRKELTELGVPEILIKPCEAALFLKTIQRALTPVG